MYTTRMATICASNGPPAEAYDETVARPSGRPAWFAWWYVCIAAGFLLLAVRQATIGGSTVGIVVRVIVALGFAALAYTEMRKNVG